MPGPLGPRGRPNIFPGPLSPFTQRRIAVVGQETTAFPSDSDANGVTTESSSLVVTGLSSTDVNGTVTDTGVAGWTSSDTNGRTDEWAKVVPASGAISFINGATAFGNSNASTVVQNVPASVADNDLLLWFTAYNTTTPTTPSGWSVWSVGLNEPPNFEGRAFYRIASSEPSSYSMTLGSTGKFASIMVAFRNVDTITPSDATPTLVGGTGASSYTDPVAITSVTDNAMLVTFQSLLTASGVNNTTWSTSGNDAADVTGTNAGAANVAAIVFYQTTTTAGSYDPTATPTPNTGTRNVAITSALRPGGTGGTVVLTNDEWNGTTTESASVVTTTVVSSSDTNGTNTESQSVGITLADTNTSTTESTSLTATLSTTDANGTTTQSESIGITLTDTNTSTTETTSLATALSGSDTNGTTTQTESVGITLTDTNTSVTESTSQTATLSGSDVNGSTTQTESVGISLTDTNTSTTETTSLVVAVSGSDTNTSTTESTSQTAALSGSDVNGSTSETEALRFAVTDTNTTTTETASVAVSSTDANGTTTETAIVTPFVVVKSAISGANSPNADRVTVTLPAGITTGDVLVATAVCKSSNTTFTTPTGWTILESHPSVSAGTAHYTVYTYMKNGAGTDASASTSFGALDAVTDRYAVTVVVLGGSDINSLSLGTFSAVAAATSIDAQPMGVNVGDVMVLLTVGQLLPGTGGTVTVTSATGYTRPTNGFAQTGAGGGTNVYAEVETKGFTGTSLEDPGAVSTSVASDFCLTPVLAIPTTSTLKSWSDTNGTTTENTSLTRAISDTETNGTTTENTSLTAAISTTEANGTTTESTSQTAALSSTDTNGTTTQSEAVRITLTDTNTSATETASLVAAVSSTDSGTDTETQSVDTGSTQISSSDSGSVTEATNLAVAQSTSDTTTGTDATSLAVTLSGTETGSGADTSVSIGVSLADTGTSTDTASLVVAVSDTESATSSSTESLTAALSSTDTGTSTSTEALATSLSDTDTSTTTETASLATSQTVTDSGTASETELALATRFDTDTASGSDTASLLATIPDSDTATTSVTATVGDIAVSSSDSATGSSTETIRIIPAASNIFDGGTSGTTITTANSGGASGNAFDVVSVSPANVDYSTLAAHGALSGEFTPGSGIAFVEYATKVGVQTEIYSRTVFRFNSLPDGRAFRIFTTASGATTAMFANVRLDGAVEIGDSTGAILATTTTVIPTGAWVRLETHQICNGTNGTVEARLYTSDMDAVVADEVLQVSGNFATSVRRYRWGVVATGATTTTVGYLDDIGVTTDGWWGPAGTPVYQGYDTGTATETASLTVTLTDDESATSTEVERLSLVDFDSNIVTSESASAVQTLAQADTATGTDTASVATQIAGNDAGTATDAQSVGTALSGTEAAGATESHSLSAHAQDTDTGAATDTLVTIGLTQADTGTGTDTQARNDILVSSSDSAFGAETAYVDIVFFVFAPVETAAALDAQALTALLIGTDSGVEAETQVMTRTSVIVSDRARGFEHQPILVRPIVYAAQANVRVRTLARRPRTLHSEVVQVVTRPDP